MKCLVSCVTYDPAFLWVECRNEHLHDKCVKSTWLYRRAIKILQLLFIARSRIKLLVYLQKFQRGGTEAQNGYGFCMLLGYGSLNWHVSSSALICSWFQCSRAWNLPVRGAIPKSAAAWTLIFEKPYAVSDQPAHQTEWCLVFWSPYNK